MKTDLFLTEHGIEHDVIPHRSTYDAQRMAQTLHVPGRVVAKTVLLRADRGYAYVVAVLPATRQLDFEKVSKALGGSKIELATEIEIAEHCPDCEIGVLPPFGSQYGMRTLVDDELTFDEEIVFECNTHDEAIRMQYQDFRQVEEPLVASITVDAF